MAQQLFAEAGRRGLVIPIAEFRARLGGDVALKKVYGALTVVEKPQHGRPKHIPRATRRAYMIVRERGVDFLILPRIRAGPLLRARAIDGVRAASDALPLPRTLAPERCVIEEPLYPYQESIVNHLTGDKGPLGITAVNEHRGVSYLQLDPGLGKTRIGCAVIAARAEPALVVVPTEAIAGQWIEEFEEILPLMKVALFHNPPKGSKKIPPGPATHDVVIIIINTFRDKDPEFMEGFGTAVLDESHELHAPCSSRALWLSQCRAVLGLSGTPAERKDELDRYVTLHLGAPLEPATIPGFDPGAVNFTASVEIVEFAGNPEHCASVLTPSGTASAIMTIGSIINDEARLRMIAAKIEQLYRLHETASPAELERLGLGPRPESAATDKHPAGEIRRHGVFVFAEHRAYLPAIKKALLERMKPEEILAPELDPTLTPGVSILRGGVSNTEVSRTRKAGAHIVLTTYGFSRRGVSLPDMTALVETTPRRNGARQILGRIFRRGSDESIQRLIVDIVDVRTSLKSQAKDRIEVYREKKFPMIKTKVDWTTYARPLTMDAPVPELQLGVAAYEDVSTEDLLASILGETPRVGLDDCYEAPVEEKPARNPAPIILRAPLPIAVVDSLDDILGL